MRAKACRTAASSPRIVLPAMMTGRLGEMRKNRSTRSRGRPCAVGGRDLERIELQAAGHRHARGIGAEIDQPARRFLALHAEPIDVGEHAPEERADEPVTRIRARRDPAVDHDRLHAALPAHPQQVRPDLGLHHDEDARLDDVERAADDERPVERKIEHRVHVMQAAARHFLPGHGRGGQEQAQARIAGLEVLGEGPRGRAPRRPTPRGSRSIPRRRR